MTGSANSVQLVPYGPPALEALAGALRDLKADDPLAPVTVAVPSPYAGLSLRRTLPTLTGPVLNVRFTALTGLAELLGGAALASSGRRPLSPTIRLAAVRAVLADDPGPFRAVATNPATERSAERAIEELSRLDDEDRARVAAASKQAAHLVRLHDAFRARTSQWYSPVDVVVAAAEAVTHGTPLLNDVGAVVLHLTDRFSAAERALVSALAEATAVRAVVGITGDPAGDQEAVASARMLEEMVGAAAAAPSAEPPIGTLVARAPDPAEEVRSAARWLLGLAERGVPLHRTAILYRHTEPYALLVHEVLHAAGIPHNGRRPRTLAQSISGRTLLGLLEIPRRGFRRTDVMAWLAAAPILERPGGPRAPVSRWDDLARRAGVVAGLAQWEQRLRFAEEELERRWRERNAADRADRADRAEQPDGSVESGGDNGDDRRRRRIEQSERLRRFVTELADTALPEKAGSWVDLITWARAALRRYLGAVRDGGPWPAEVVDDHAAVIAALDALASLDAVGVAPTADAFRQAIEQQLSVSSGRVGRFGEGVFVGTIAGARGMSFDAIAILGMAEGRFPPRHDHHGVLLDDVRVAAGGALLTAADKRAAERRDYLAALASAPRTRLSWPAADPRGQRGEAPARWLLETAAALRGRPLTAAELQSGGAEDWFEAIPSVQAAVVGASDSVSLGERRLRLLTSWVHDGGELDAHPVAATDPVIPRGTATVRARSGSEFTAWDGLTGPGGRVLEAGAPVSPTSLETWATCPFRYFLSRVLGVRATEDPDEIDAISPLDRGALVHSVLERLVSEGLAPAEPQERWSAEARRRVLEIAEELGLRYERGGRTGSPLRWRLEWERIRRELLQVLDLDDAQRAQSGVLPVAVEMAFGPDAGTPVTLRLPSGGEVSFHGYVDRVDRSSDGERLEVTDYKTGRAPPEGALEADPVVRGTLLQLPVYGLAAKARFGGSSVRTGYWFVSERGGFRRQGYELDDEKVSRLAEVVEVISTGVTTGIFPARPGEEDLRPGMAPSFDNCRMCDYDRLCVADRGDAWDRKRATSEVAEYVALAEGVEP